VPDPAPAQDSPPQPTEELTTALHTFLDPRRVLTTRHHIVGPGYVDINITTTLGLYEDAPPKDALHDIRRRLETFFDPLHGGNAGNGWPFGRNVYASEVYAVLEQSEFVDYAEELRLTRPDSDAGAPEVDIELDAHQLVRLTTLDLVLYDHAGKLVPPDAS
jgi:hypothetical protein